MSKQWRTRIYLSLALVLLVASSACIAHVAATTSAAVPLSPHASASVSSVSSPLAISPLAKLESVSIATIATYTDTQNAGINRASRYIFHDKEQRSKLRHGHQEFTINLVDGYNALIIAFYGYTGPHTYLLENRVNGGDVRLSTNEQYWDLALQPTAVCTLQILSDTPTSQIGIDTMRGEVACPQVAAGPRNATSSPIAIRSSVFMILMRVES
jgi:hypothetical protein